MPRSADKEQPTQLRYQVAGVALRRALVTPTLLMCALEEKGRKGQGSSYVAQLSPATRSLLKQPQTPLGRLPKPQRLPSERAGWCWGERRLLSLGFVSATCLAHWKGPTENPPVCSPPPVVSCGWLAPPSNGEKEGTKYLAGSMLHFRCHPGYSLVGSVTRRCQEDGTWSGRPTSCLPNAGKTFKQFSPLAPQHTGSELACWTTGSREKGAGVLCQ